MYESVYFVFTSVYSVLGYHEYTDVNIVPWWLSTKYPPYPKVKKIDHGGGAHGVMVIVVRNKHGDTSSNSERSCLHFT